MKHMQAQELIARAVDDAIVTFEKLGWSYTVTSADGRVFTNIEPPAKKKITRPRLYNYRPLQIEKRLIESYPGEEVRFGPDPNIPAGYVQKAVSNYGKKVYGEGNYRTTLLKATGEVVFVGGSRTSMSDLDAAIAAVAKSNSEISARQTHPSTNNPQ